MVLCGLHKYHVVGLITIIMFHVVAHSRVLLLVCINFFFFFQAEDGIRDVERSRGLGDVYKRQGDYKGF